MGYSAKAVANAVLQIAETSGASLSPLKLQKLVYIAHGWHLAIKDAPLVNDEFAEAWQYGPVFPSLYHEFKKFGKGSIKDRATDFSVSDGPEFDVEVVEPEIDRSDDFTWSLLNRIWETYGKHNGLTLSDLTHQSGTPWQITWSKSDGRKNADIKNEIIQSHYKELALSRRQAAM